MQRVIVPGHISYTIKIFTHNPNIQKANNSEISNYGRISLLTSFSKVFEKVIYKGLYYYVNSNNILAKEQYGFRNNSFTEIASYNLINNILKALNSRMWVEGISCDLTKAFDHVNRNILLSKLEFCGVTGRANSLIKSCVNDRYQRVLIKNKYFKNYFSEWEKVKQGVPQGSVLGLLFYLLYINDLPGILNDISKPTIFGDDSNIIFTHSNLTEFKEEINIVIEKTSNWFQSNLLILNFSKTYYMHFITKSTLAVDIHISHKVNPINNTRSTNFLGLTLGSTLSWKTHIDQLSSKLNSDCYIIRCLKSVIFTMNLRSIYFAYFHSIASYGISFGGNSSYSKKIFTLQKRIIRIMVGTHPRI